MYVISRQQCPKKTKSNGWLSEKHTRYCITNSFVLKIEQTNQFHKRGRQQISLSWAGWVRLGWVGSGCGIVCNYLISQNMDAILDRMPANNPPPRIVLACTSSIYMFSQETEPRMHNLCVWVLHTKPFFQPVDIEHTQCPCRFFILERYKLCGHKTTTQRYDIVMGVAE